MMQFTGKKVRILLCNFTLETTSFPGNKTAVTLETKKIGLDIIVDDGWLVGSCNHATVLVHLLGLGHYELSSVAVVMPSTPFTCWSLTIVWDFYPAKVEVTTGTKRASFFGENKSALSFLGRAVENWNDALFGKRVVSGVLSISFAIVGRLVRFDYGGKKHDNL